jgi:hypothetical protein
MKITPDQVPSVEPAVRFEHYLLRARVRGVEGEPQLRVTLEDLGSGDRWTFGSGAELARFLDRLGVDQ